MQHLSLTRPYPAPLFLSLLLITFFAAAARPQSALDGFDPNANGSISAIVVQPDGKILIGGTFSTLSPNGGAAVARNRIARLNPDGTLDTAFDPNANNFVRTIALQADGKILVGGDFNGANSIGGQARNHIARLDPVTGTADSFDPNANSTVFSIAVQEDGKILAGGYFNGTNSIGGQTRNLIARLDPSTGLADSFNPNASGTTIPVVQSIVVQADGKVLVGGDFSSIGGQPRNRIARLDPATGLSDSFNPNANGHVYAIAVQADGKILAGGFFNGTNSIGGQTRNRIARLDPVNGAADSFNPNAGDYVDAIAIQADGRIWAGGGFTSIGGQTRNRIARLNAVTGVADTFDPNTDMEVDSIVVQADGKILAGGGFTELSPDGGAAVTRNRIARFECPSPGSLDTSFNGTGTVLTPLGSYSSVAYSVAIQSDGRIIVAGESADSIVNADFGLVRYNANGALDTSFNGTGKVTTPIGSGNDTALSVAIQSDGRIVAAGSSNNGSDSDFALVRYNTNGTLDTSFNGTGIVTTPIGSDNEGAGSVAIQSDGRIVAAGESNNGLDYDFALIRYNTDGTLDTSFNGTGKVTTPIGSADDNGFSVAIQSDGKIVAAGNSDNGSTHDFALVRYNTNGTLDTSFNGTGKVTTPVGTSDDGARSVAIQSDGRIVAAGFSLNGSNNDFALVRYNTNGTLDTSFNGTGKVTTPISSRGGAYSVAIQSDGRIVTVGSSFNGMNDDFVLIRYNTDGTPDASFGGGVVVTQLGIGNDTAFSLAIQSDGRIVAVGGGFNGFFAGFAVARYNGLSCVSTTATPTNTPTSTPTNTATATPTGSGTPSIGGTVTYGNVIAALAGTPTPTATPTPKFISNATVASSAGTPSVTTTTAAPGGTAGQYTLTGFGAGSYTIGVTKTTGQNSITSNDAARIAQSVAGMLPLTTNSQKVTADVTGNGLVSSNDAAKIAQFVAGLPLAPPNLTNTWQFYLPPGPSFPVGSSPTSRTYPSVTGTITGENYVGLLIGEVTGNWAPGPLRPVHTRQNAAVGADEADIVLGIPEVKASAEKEIIVPVNVHGAAGKEIISYEFDLRYDSSVIQPSKDSVDLAGTSSRGLSAVANASEPGLLRVVVYGALPIDENGVLLNLKFTAVGKPGSVSPLSFERIMFNEGEPRVVVSNGQVGLD
jgi:uncharacterized delta-60 repeat protein